MSASKINLILTSVKDGMRLIKFNRPQKKNAICPEMYTEVTRLLNEDAVNDSIVITTLTGTGDYYTSGNDVTAPSDIDLAENCVKKFIQAFINYPKLLVAVVNGPAIGIGVTTLALCDIVYASDTATFSTPFLDLALCPEGCSSYLFPRILGKSKASELLLLGQKITAPEAYKFGLISEIIPHGQLDEVFTRLQKYGKLKVNPLIRAKKLIHNEAFKNVLHEVNDREFEALRDCASSDEFSEVMLQRISKKSKL